MSVKQISQSMPPSNEQSEIINAPLLPISVIACAGSGKTFTAVRRLAEIRRQLGEHRGKVALLSFSNVAVDTFRQSYHALAQNSSYDVAHSRVEISTLDGFISSNILRPHAYRTMRSKRAAFLVVGHEAFLQGFKLNGKNHPIPIAKAEVGVDKSGPCFCYVEKDNRHSLETKSTINIINRLGKLGAYTHNLGRYWCYRTLEDQPNILRALVRRYPHILIDEAQDIGTMHQAVIELLINAGSQVSLIGDPNQGIYEFAGADGKFLRNYGQADNISALELTTNYRSVPPVVNLANLLSRCSDNAHRKEPPTPHGAFFVPYESDKQLIDEFQTAVLAAGLRLEQSAVLCRGREKADRLAGNGTAPGQGIVKRLARAAILRDKNHDYLSAFKEVSSCVADLLAGAPEDLVARITQPLRCPSDRLLRQLIWAFTRDSNSGLPATTLVADTQWHPLLKARLQTLLGEIKKDYGWEAVSNLGAKLAKKDMPKSPLYCGGDTKNGLIRVATVHQVKGESLDAVLYLANKEHVRALLLEGVTTELGRIGYVAVTRARDLLWLAVPANALTELKPDLVARGFQPSAPRNWVKAAEDKAAKDENLAQ